MKAVTIGWVVVIAVVAAALGAWAGHAGYASQHGCKSVKGTDGKVTTTCAK